MNENEAQRIAAAITRARPDWPHAQVLTLIETRLMDRPRRDVFVALAWVASETASASPYRVLEAGPWWRAAGVESETGGAVRNHFDPASSCDECSQPQHRHGPTSGHDFVSVVDARRRRDNSPKPALPRVRQEIQR